MTSGSHPSHFALLIVLRSEEFYGGDCESDTSCDLLEQAYHDWANLASFQGHRWPLLATLDDHDYGGNDVHGDNPHKEYARGLFQEFFQVEDLPEDGVYQAYEFGEEGERLQVILLDTRYSRSPFVERRDNLPPFGPYTPTLDNTTQMLSPQQWTWLGEQLRRPADLRLVISSIQVLDDGSHAECWRMLPHERDRLYNLLPSNTVLLSGDRHVGGLYEAPEGFVEMTASAWTHSGPCREDPCQDEEDPNRIDDFVHVNNFGTVEIDWERREYTLAIRRADSSYGITYQEGYGDKRSDAGEVQQNKTYSFV